MQVSTTAMILKSLLVATLVLPIDAVADRFEFRVSSVRAADGTYSPGDSIPVHVDVQNHSLLMGRVNFLLTLYASTNTIITSADTSLGTIGLYIFDPGPGSFDVLARVPDSIAGGNYYIGAQVTPGSTMGRDTGFDPSPITISAPAGISFRINAGLNDAWYDPSTYGQGFFVTVYPDIRKVFLSWFTFDLERPADGVTAELGEPGHRWLTAFGSYDGDTAHLEIELTKDAISNDVPDQTVYGTLLLQFSNCNSGEVSFEIPELNLSGAIPIQRAYASPDKLALCEDLQSP